MVSAAAMAFGLFYTSCGNDARDVEGRNAGPAAIMIGDVPVTPQQIDQQMQQQLAQSSMGAQGLDPRMQGYVLTGIVEQTIRSAANLIVAQHLGVDMSDAGITKYITQEIDEETAKQRQQFIAAGQLKPDATDAQFEAEFKKQPFADGKTSAEMKADILKKLPEVLADPARKQALISQNAQGMALAAIKAKSTVTNEEIKSSYDTDDLQRVLFPLVGKKQADVEALAKSVLEQIKSNKLTFPQAMDRYNAPPPSKAKPSSIVDHLGVSDIRANTALKPLLNLKPGETSEILTLPEGLAIYRLLGVKNNAPADFDKNIAKYRDDYLTKIATADLNKQVDDVVNSDVVKFPMPGYKALYDLSQLNKDFGLMQSNPAAYQDKARAVADEARKAVGDKELADDSAATVAWYAAFDGIYNQAKDKAPLRQERIDVLEAVLKTSESFGTRMELVQLGIDTKNADLASMNLIDAARSNVQYDVQGEQQFRDVNSKLDALKAAKLITPDQVTEVENIQNQWRTDKAANDKAEKEAKAAQAAEAKKNGANPAAPGSPVGSMPVPTPSPDAPVRAGNGVPGKPLGKPLVKPSGKP